MSSNNLMKINQNMSMNQLILIQTYPDIVRVLQIVIPVQIQIPGHQRLRHMQKRTRVETSPCLQLTPTVPATDQMDKLVPHQLIVQASFVVPGPLCRRYLHHRQEHIIQELTVIMIVT